MKHYDENIIDLYILGDEKISSLRNEIETHLNNCYSCSEIYTQLKEFYSNVEGDSRSILETNKFTLNNSLIIKPEFGKENGSISPIPKTFVSRSIYFIRTQPVKSGLSLVAALAIFLFGLNYKTITMDRNPAYSRTNDSKRAVEVFNKNGEELFGLYYNLLENKLSKLGENEFEWNIKNTVVYDLDRDGKNEIISVVPRLGNFESVANLMRVFNYKGELLFAKTIGDTCSFIGMHAYDNDFFTRGIIIDDFDGSGKPEIIVGAFNRRSPYVLTRLDAQGNKLGEYWHYGTIWGINEIFWKGKKRILLCGINDITEPKSKATIEIIDPSLIVGKVQSRSTEGFRGIPLITAEESKSFPWTKYNDIFNGIKPRIISLLSSSEKSEIKIAYQFDPNRSNYAWHILLDTNLTVKQVVPNDAFVRDFGKIDNNILEQFTK